LKQIIIVGLGGFIGASLRYMVGFWISQFHKAGFPFNTFLINICGCFLLGLFLGMGLDKNLEFPLKEFVLIGILGGFTTFSAFGLETYEMINNGQFKLSIIYGSSSILLGVLAVATGIFISN
tara:strand:+ start:218 stop:583 length:366 start_codon:yes stop_codon:yes gene_type:complete